MAQGTHEFEDDPRNERIVVWVNGELLPRERAVVSVFDSGFILGDGVWEGLRVRYGHPAFVGRHLDRVPPRRAAHRARMAYATYLGLLQMAREAPERTMSDREITRFMDELISAMIPT